jgi:cardiolipin synthase
MNWGSVAGVEMSFGLLLWLGLLIYWAAVIVMVIASDREPSTTLAWILVLLLFPGFGIIFYFFAGRDWRGWLAKQPVGRKWMSIRVPFMDKQYAPWQQFSARKMDEYVGTPVEGVARSIIKSQLAPLLPATSMDIYASGEEYFPVWIDDLAGAKDFIHLQYFIWEYDELTAKVTTVLHDRLKAGVEVRMLNDYLGCLPYKKDEMKRLKEAGAQILADMTQIGRLNYRNHRKITVIDGEIGHSGGFNIGQEYIDGGKKYPAWRDTGIRMTGPIVADLSKLFADRWYEVEKVSLCQERYFPRHDIELPDDVIAAQIVAHGVEDYWESARRTHAVAISSARERVWLQSPYFVPDQGTYDAMINAALAGRDVRLMMTEWPDHKLAWRAAESYYKPLLSAGGRIFRWKPGFFHAKTLTIDGIASAIGTMNLDTRSLKLHKELMVWAYDEGVARRCEEIFEADMADCREITLEEVLEWGTTYRFVNSAARLTSNMV